MQSRSAHPFDHVSSRISTFPDEPQEAVADRPAVLKEGSLAQQPGAPPGDLVEMHIHWLHPRPSESESGVGAQPALV